MTGRALGEVDFVLLGVPDVNGMLRGKTLTRSEFERVTERGHMALSRLIFALDFSDDQIDGLPEFGLSSGASDILVRPDLSTLAPLSWRPGWAICIGTPTWSDGSPVGVAPRVLLEQVQAANPGVTVRAALEYEVRIVSADGGPVTGGLQYSLVDAAHLADLTEALSAACVALGIDLGVVHTEGGHGLVEFNVSPSDAVRAADEATLLKTCLKQLARTMGLSVSFLAKQVEGEEGSGGHLHVSLWDGQGRSLFAGDPVHDGISDPMSHAIAGLLELMPAMSLLYNPTINSYKRVIERLFAPVTASWGLDNRSTAVRAITGTPESTRVEIRRPGADANPYLVLAAALGSMAHGLSKGVPAPAPATGDASQPPPGTDRLPSSLEEAVRVFEADPVAQAVLGSEFSDYFAATRRWELRAWQRTVTDWERGRYGPVV
ncbi:MAG: glutamine synthetase [Chloroflexota bacterium]|nr:glutamine synthetase [Chloroflexota bacterium]